MSTRTIRGYGPILLSSKRGNHRSKRYYWYKVELDNGRRTREILFVPPINPILNSGQAENDCDALSHQTAAVQRFSLTVKANESAFSNANVRQTFFLRSAWEKQCSDAKRVSCVSFHIRNYHVEEGGKNLNFLYQFAVLSRYNSKYFF